MAFLFKSKKNADKSQPMKDGSGGVAGSPAPLQGGNSRINEKGTATSGASVNNSLKSLQAAGNGPPSPEQTAGRRGPSTEQAQDLLLRNGTAPAVQPMSTSTNASLYPWSQRRLSYTTSHPPPFPRYGAAVNAVASKEGDIYLMGGLINSSTVKGDLWMVEAGGNMVCYPLATTSEGPGPRVGHASLLVGNAFIVYGGDTKLEDSDILDETLYLLNTSTRQWSRAVPAGPRPAGRYGHSLNILGSKIYVFGGQVEGFFMNDLVAFDLNQLQVPTNRWEMLMRNTDEGGLPSAQTPPARTNHSIVTYNEKLYLFGGTNGFQWFNDVWCYDPIPNAWVSLDCIGYIPAPREGHAAAIVDDVMYIFGGRTEEGLDLGDLAAFRITSRRWYTFQNMGPSPSPRSGHSMTAYGKQIVVLAGEPSTATREAGDLGIVYLLDTSKIRYPNDQGVQPLSTSDRVPGARRPSTADKSIMAPGRGTASRDGSSLLETKRMNGLVRESVVTRTNDQPGVNGNDINGVAPGSAQPQSAPQGALASSKLPRASASQSTPGPPPQQQAPAPRTNGAVLNTNGRGKTQQRPEKSSGPAIDTSVRSGEGPSSMSPAQSRTISPAPTSRETSLTNGQRTPTNQTLQLTNSATRESGTPISMNTVGSGSTRSSKTRYNQQQGSIDSTSEQPLRNVTNIRQISPPPVNRTNSNPLARKGSSRNSQTVSLLKELDSAKNRNAWYASELELARKAGYTTNVTISALDQMSTEFFDDDDKPLVEALIAMKTELSNVQGSIDKQAIIAAKQIAEVEKQRDAAIKEAVYARAKLAANSGSQRSTPQPDSEAQDLGNIVSDRSADISKKLAASLADQRELQNRVESLNSELEAENRNRRLAEDISTAMQTRMVELEAYKQQNAAEVEQLRAELHELQVKAREEAVVCAEAVAAVELLKIEKEELTNNYEDAIGLSKSNNESFESLRKSLALAEDMRKLLQLKLDEERTEREKLESQLSQIRSEHEIQGNELEIAVRKLKDAEECAEKSAAEAKIHREAVISGLDKVVSRDLMSKTSTSNDRLAALQAQVQSANNLVRKHQAAADAASEKLRSAEERIAGLEAYQEQASREGMSIRKQLQSTMREVQSFQAVNSDLRHQLANQQLETNAVHVQHNTLKDILGERGISPVSASRSRGISITQSASEATQLKELEQQLSDTKQMYETRAQEAERTYKEKLTQLENDYQSAVHYVKGTEKMLKRLNEELAKYKSENDELREEVLKAEDKGAASVEATWDEERSILNGHIESLQTQMQTTVHELESQLTEIRKELRSVEQERDAMKKSLDESKLQAQTDLGQIQKENVLLEQRASDAEQKVSLLLDQVEHSVDTYRRQSRQPEVNGVPATTQQRAASATDSVSETSLFDGASRNSMALEGLANELETLRSHWQNTLSSTYYPEDHKLLVQNETSGV